MCHIACCVLTLLLLAPARSAAGQFEWKNVPRVVAVGDVHGDYAAFVAVLRSAGLIDQRDHWIGGKSHLVQTGDVPDRGPDTRKVMDLMMALEKEAAKAGGHVHALIGNHEAMNMYGDLRYTTPGEFAAFVTPESERVRAGYWKQESRKLPRPNFEDRRKWEDAHPMGWFEHRLQYGPQGTYGAWIRSHNAIVKIDDAIYLHGGISERYASMPLKQINEIIAAELGDLATMQRDGPVLAEDGPLWDRGMATDESPAAAALVDKVLAAYGVKRIVIGHTPTAGAVVPRFGGKVVRIDVGLAAVYGSHRACLVIEGDSVSVVHRGEKLPLPPGGAEFVSYLKKALSLEPPGSSLAKYTTEVEASMAAAK